MKLRLLHVVSAIIVSPVFLTFTHICPMISRTSLQLVARMKNVTSAKSNVVLALVMVALPSRSLTILKDSVLEKCWSSSVV